MRQYIRSSSHVAVVLVLVAACGWQQHNALAETLTRKHCVIEFQRRDAETAELVGAVIDECWVDVASAVGANPQSGPVRVIVPASLEEFRASAGGRDERWVVAAALHPQSVILVKPARLIPPSLRTLRGTVLHELTHIMLSRVSDVHRMPRWLNEGIAMRVSGEMKQSADWRIAAAVVRGTLIPLDRLDGHFPSSHEGASLAYAESLSVVTYIAESYGEEALLRLVRSLRDHDLDAALASSLGLNLPELSAQWIRSVRISPYVFTLVASSLALWAMTVLTIVAFVRKMRIARRKKRQWDMEEAAQDNR